MYGGSGNNQYSAYQQQFSTSRDPRLSASRNLQEISSTVAASTASISLQVQSPLAQQQSQHSSSFLPTELLAKAFPSLASFQKSFSTATFLDSPNKDVDLRHFVNNLHAVAQSIPSQSSNQSQAATSSHQMQALAAAKAGYQRQASADFFPASSYSKQLPVDAPTVTAVSRSINSSGSGGDLTNLLDRLAQYSTTYQYAVDADEEEPADDFGDRDRGGSHLSFSDRAGIPRRTTQFPTYEDLQRQKEEKFRQLEAQFGRGVMKAEPRDPTQKTVARLPTPPPAPILTAKVAPVQMAVPPKYAPPPAPVMTSKVLPTVQRPPAALSPTISPAQIQSLVPNEKVRELLNAMGVSDQALIQKLTTSVQQRLYDSAQNLQQPQASIPPPAVLTSVPQPASFQVKPNNTSPAIISNSSKDKDERKRTSAEGRKRKSSSPSRKKSASSKKRQRHRSSSGSSGGGEGCSTGSSAASDEEAEDFAESPEKKQWRALKKLMKKGRKMSTEDRQLLERELKKIDSSFGAKQKLLSTQETRFALLQDEMTHLRQQHNTMCRRLQRQKRAGASDPLMTENEQLQAEMERQLDSIEKSRKELGEELSTLQKRKEKLSKALGLKMANKKDKNNSESFDDVSKQQLTETDCEYFDAGSHWCRCCNLTFGTFQDFANHLHTSKHTENCSDSKTGTPWRPDHLKYGIRDRMSGTKSMVKPFRGVEFMLPMVGYYCDLCHEMIGDSVCAEDHLRSFKHNSAYQKYTKDNPYYEQRFNLDRTAATALLKRPTPVDPKSAATPPFTSNLKEEEEKVHRESLISRLGPKKEDDKGVRIADAVNRFYSGRATTDDRRLLDETGWKPPASKKTAIPPAWVPGLKVGVRSQTASSSARDYDGRYDRDRRRSRSRDRDERGRDRVELSRYN